MTGIADLLALTRPQGSVTEIPKTTLPGPFMLGQPTGPVQNLGQVGPPPGPPPMSALPQEVAPAPAQDPPEEDVTARFQQLLQQFSRPGGQLPGPVAGPVAPPPDPVEAGSEAPVRTNPRLDGRQAIREFGQALVSKGSPAQRVQGLQLIFEANKETPEEAAARAREVKLQQEADERERLTSALDIDEGMDANMKTRSKMAIQLGAKPEDVLKLATGGDEAAKREKERRESLSKWSQGRFTDAQTTGVVDVAANKAFELIDKGDFTTGTGAWFAQKVPGSDAQALVKALEPIQATIGFDRLQQMRDQSKTGGALGSVSQMELTFLQATQGSLDPVNVPPDDLKANILTINEGRKLLSQMHALIPRLDAGDPEAHDQAAQLAQEIGTLSAKVRKSVSAERERENLKAGKPPVDGAKKAPDGQYYVERDGQYYRVEVE